MHVCVWQPLQGLRDHEDLDYDERQSETTTSTLARLAGEKPDSTKPSRCPQTRARAVPRGPLCLVLRNVIVALCYTLLLECAKRVKVLGGRLAALHRTSHTTLSLSLFLSPSLSLSHPGSSARLGRLAASHRMSHKQSRSRCLPSSPPLSHSLSLTHSHYCSN